ncbi:MAG: single-stranded-DNA-specific exonuclease RecJ, partial [Flavobacterium sp.]|nr:single-stranded-DNA-specific exonuclease RecJ [Flavobacterium sp.]
MRWTLKPKAEPEKAAKLADALKCELLIAELLIQRGIETFDDAKKFFRPTLDDLHDPYLMKDMDLAVARV